MNSYSFLTGGFAIRNQDKRTEIMQVAMELLAEHGFHRVPMSMIADRAEVAVGTIYLYFSGKDELINELFLDLERKIVADLREGFPTERPIRERFLYLSQKILRYLTGNPPHFRYFEQYINSPYGVSMHRNRLLEKTGRDDIFMTLFEEAITNQVVKDLPLAVLFAITIAPLIFLARDHILGFVNLNDPLIRQVTEASWDAIKR